MRPQGPPALLIPTTCALCGTHGNAEELYASTVELSLLTTPVFSARRVPDRRHFRIVRCRACGLVRSDPMAELSVLEALYEGAGFTYGEEVSGLRSTYGRYLRKLEPHLSRRRSLLDIGCGNGFLLEEALAQGYEDARGVEPAEAAARAAAPHIRDRIVVGPMREGLFEPASFDVVTLFQTLDHLPEPNAVIAEAARLLTPGGILLCLNHDVRALSARLLGEHSPIFDLQHTYLYSQATLRRLVENHGLQPVSGGAVANRYSLRYLAQLLPIPSRAKQRMLAALERTPVGELRLTVPLGNLWLAAQKR
jgi:SAM-dependent methyltransferase